MFGQKTFEYRGPLPRAVAGIISRLPDSERSLARSWADDFTDYILDDVKAGVERTLVLVEVCTRQLGISMNEIVSKLPWAEGIKKGEEWKRQRVADELRSMIQLGIPLPQYVNTILAANGNAVFEFDEIAFATGPRRLKLSWQDFKRQQQIDDRFVRVLESEDNADTAAESFDYGSISMARVALSAPTRGDLELETDLRMLGESLGVRISSTLDDLHCAKQCDGYRPIAWHNVFWNLCSDYEGLQLALKLVDPFCSTDQKLAEWVSDHYREVVGTSRPVIFRRRKSLHETCTKLIETALYEKFG